MKAQLVLGFDFGTKYIGVAIGQTETLNARPLTSIKVFNQKINWQLIDKLIKDWQPAELIVGIPLDMDGKEQPITLKCLKFFNQLQQKYNLPTHKIDERLSTWEAKNTLRLNKVSYSSKELLDINASAAAILIQHYFNSIKINN